VYFHKRTGAALPKQSCAEKDDYGTLF